MVTAGAISWTVLAMTGTATVLAVALACAGYHAWRCHGYFSLHFCCTVLHLLPALLEAIIHFSLITCDVHLASYL